MVQHFEIIIPTSCESPAVSARDGALSKERNVPSLSLEVSDVFLPTTLKYTHMRSLDISCIQGALVWGSS